MIKVATLSGHITQRFFVLYHTLCISIVYLHQKVIFFIQRVCIRVLFKVIYKQLVFGGWNWFGLLLVRLSLLFLLLRFWWTCLYAIISQLKQILRAGYINHLLYLRLDDCLVFLRIWHFLEIKNVNNEVEFGHQIIESLHHFIRVFESQHFYTYYIILTLGKKGNTSLGVDVDQFLLCHVQILLYLLEAVNYFQIFCLTF